MDDKQYKETLLESFFKKKPKEPKNSHTTGNLAAHFETQTPPNWSTGIHV